MNLFESINNSLNNTVKSLSEEYLTEKKQKQEISPEDQRDNEIIRDIIRRNTYDITPEELEVLDRNNITRNYGTYHTPLGTFDMYDLEHDYVYPPKDMSSVLDKVNFADMGRKQEEREKYHSFYNDAVQSNNRVKRGTKKKPSVGGDRTNRRNTLDIERKAIDNKLRLNLANFKYNKKHLLATADEINRTYERAEEDRNYWLQKIKEYKQMLKDIEKERDEKVDKYSRSMKTWKEANDNLLKAKRDRIQELRNRRDNKNESLLLERRQEMSDEDKRDNELIRDLLDRVSKTDKVVKPTKEEQDALDRNNLSFDLSSGYITTRDSDRNILGMIEPSGYITRHTVQGQCMNTDKINYADFGRKRNSRKSFSSDNEIIDNSYGSRGVRRGYKKKVRDLYSPYSYFYSPFNQENIMHKAQNLNLKEPYINLSTVLGTAKRLKNKLPHNLESVYTKAEEFRTDFNNEIKMLKQQIKETDDYELKERIKRRIKECKDSLNNIDKYIEKHIKEYIDDVKTSEKSVSDILSNARKRVQDVRERKGRTKED